MKKIFFLICCILCGGAISKAAPLSFVGTYPENGAQISSFNDILLKFDLTDIINEYGEGEWGICCNGFYFSMLPQMEKSVALYKGNKDSGEVLDRMYETIDVTDEGFKVGSDFHISFPNVQVESGQEYTIVVTYNMFAGRKEDSSWIGDTEYSFANNPLSITFYGASDVAKVLSVESNSIENGVQYATIPSVKIAFNHEIAVNEGAVATLMEETTTIASSSNIVVSSDDAKSVVITFPEETIYNGHIYNVILPEGSISVAGESDVVNSEISIQLEGASYRSFGTGRVRPSNNSVTVLGEITIPFNFPTAEGKNYGFVALDNGDQTPFTAYLYAGNDDSTEPIETMIGDVTSDSKGLVFSPSITPEPESAYTLVIPEGNVKAYEIGAIRNTYLKDYISERIELHYTTPAISDLPLWQPNAVNVSEGSELDHIDYFIVNCPDYEYDGTIYETVASQTDDLGGVLYEVTADGEKEISTFRITRQALTTESEIGSGQYVGRHFVGEVNQDLYAGKEYRVVMTANKFIVKNNFIGNYIGNSEVSVTVKGAASTEMKSEFTNNIVEGQTASNLGVVSIYTNDPVAAVEGAVIELRNGEDVKTASIRVAAEEGYSHIYADFSDADHKALALDRATEYTVVLPQGSLTHAENENLVNNEYSFSVNGLEKEAEPIVPEYVSVDFMIDNYASTSYRMVKGEPSTIKVNATDEWYLKSLTLNGEDVIENVSEEGFYTLPALEADAELAAEFSYFEDLEMTETTGVGTIDGSNGTISVYNDGGVIVIENLAAGDNVAVYTVNGMVIKSFVASKDIMYIDAPMGQVYIIRVNNGAVKLQH